MNRWDFIDAFPATGLGSAAFWVFVHAVDANGPIAPRPTAWAKQIGAHPGTVKRAIATLCERRILIRDAKLLRPNPEVDSWRLRGGSASEHCGSASDTPGSASDTSG